MNDLIPVTAADYHDDNIGDQPTLNATVAKLLCTRSPAHAFTAHPRLNPDYERDTDQKYDIGTAFHAVMLEGRHIVATIDAADWRKHEAKEAREIARSAGLIPLLTRQADELDRMVAAARTQLASLDVDPAMFTDGKPEQTLVWEDSGVTCRARLDWLRDDLATIDDIKTTRASANPEQWTRTMYGMAADIQAAFYIRGVKALTGAEPEFRFLAVECEAPFALSVIGLAPAALALANARVDYAIDLWKKCLASGEWPGYPTRVCFAEPPSYVEYAWLEKEAREEFAA